MDTFADTHSGFHFCINMDDPLYQDIIVNGISDYDHIKWCQDFLTHTGIFVDIGANMGTYSVILSKKCREVYSFESDKNAFDRLNIGLCVNTCFNVNSHNVSLCSENIDNFRTLDSFNIKGIEFMRIVVNNEYDVIKGAEMTLINNKFPPLLLEVHSDEWYRRDSDKAQVLLYVKDLGYEIKQVNGLNNTYLACNHKVRQVKDEVINDQQSDIVALSVKYESGELDNITWDKWHELATYYRKLPSNTNGNSRVKAYDCAMRGLKCSPPIDKEYLLYEEIAIVSFYLNKKTEGYQACDNVIFSPHAPWSTRNYTLNNQSFYMKRIPFKKILSIKHDIPHDQIESTSSLIENNGSYLLNLMTVNYSIDDKGVYQIKDKDDIVKNQSFLLTLEKDLSLRGGIALEDKSNMELYQQNIRGFENVRLFSANDMLCTYRAVNPTHTHQICYCKYDSPTGRVTKIIPLIIGGELKDEHGWLPFIDNNVAYFVYKLSPLTLYKLDRETGVCELIKETIITEKNLESFIGSGGLIPYKNGWLGTCHQVYNNTNLKNFHRLIWIDGDFTELKYSEAFYFESPNIEFNLSICHSDEGLLIPYSQRDNTSKIGVLNYEIVNTWLSL